MKSAPMNVTYRLSSRNFGAAIGKDHRNPRLLGFAKHRLKSSFDDRGEYDHIDLLGDEGADGLDLVLLLLLGVGEFQIDAALGRLVLDGLVELAVRQADSAPTWAKPTTSLSAAN